jgi:hypothetical protein
MALAAANVRLANSLSGRIHDGPGGEQDHAGSAQDVDGSRSPCVGGAAEADEQHEGGDRQRQQDGPPVVDDPLHPAQVAGQDGGGHDQRQGTDRHVEVEDPPPAGVLGEEAAEQRADDGRDGEDSPEQALVLAPLPGLDHVADDRLGADHEPTGPEALQGTEGDQHVERLADPGQGRADEEDDDRRLEELLAPVEVAELAPQRRGHRRGQQVGGDDPGDVGGAAEVADDGGQRRRHHRLVEGGEQHAQHEGADDDEHPPAVEVQDRASGVGGRGLEGLGHGTLLSGAARPAPTMSR